MRRIHLAAALVLLLQGAAATGQTITPLFDERDVPGADYYQGSAGAASGGDELLLAGPDGTRLPLESSSAYSGVVSGRLTYRHVDGGAWAMRVDAPGSPPIDFTTADSLVFFVNGPAPVLGPHLPRVALEDGAGRRTAALGFPLGTHIGFNGGRSGFLPGSSTDAHLTVTYVDSRPADQPRPGYPEDITVTFADVPLDTSLAAVGLPATPAHFRVDAATGIQLRFRFRDLNGDRTLSASGEFIDILTADAGGPTLRPTWRLAVANNPTNPPGQGDGYLLAVDNAGLDADSATWQRVGIAMGDFGPLGELDLTQVRGVRFSEGGSTDGVRTVWFDAVRLVDRGPNPSGPPPPTAIAPAPGDSAIVLRWTPAGGAAGYHVYRRSGTGEPFVRLNPLPVRTPDFADLNVGDGQVYTYVLRSLTSGNVPGEDSAPIVSTTAPGAGDPFLDLAAQRAFDFFWREANPANGLIRDRSTAGSASSIAAVGMGLTAITIGIDRAWISRNDGRQRVLNTLRFFWNAPQGPASSGVTGHHGFFYHFLDMNTGHRAGTTELSTIDTALLLGGVLDMKQYFTGSDAAEAEIRALSDSIYRRVDWNWASPRAPLVSHGWRPETGFIGNDWVGYNEAMILYLLALGSPTHSVPDEAWTAWTNGYAGQWGTFYGYTFLSFPPLFGHQYSHLWVDFRGIADAYMRGQGIDYFENSRRATLAQRAYSIDNPGNYPNYGPNEWGLTASDVPSGYLARGAPPPQNDNGTIAPTAPGGSVPFSPAETVAALRHLYDTYGSKLWGVYGFRDAYSVSQNWVGQAFLGIDQGPFVIMIENLRSEAVWNRFMQNADVQRGLERAGFLPFVAAEPGQDPPPPLSLAAAPNPATGVVDVRYSLPEGGRASMAVYDVLGRQVLVLADRDHAAGDYAASFDASALPSGVYILRLEMTSGRSALKLTVVR